MTYKSIVSRTVQCDAEGCYAMIESTDDELHVCGKCNGQRHASTANWAVKSKWVRRAGLKSRRAYLDLQLSVGGRARGDE